MNKEFIPYEQALELKELGFDEECVFKYYLDRYEGTLYQVTNGCKNFQLYKGSCTAPLYQQAFRWFREKHNMLVCIYSNASGFLYEYHDTIGGTHRFDSGFSGDCEHSGTFTTYEKAELACLKKLIEIVKNK